MIHELYAPFFAGLAVTVILMGLVFAAGRKIQNYGIVDVAWSWAFALLVLVYVSLVEGHGDRKWILAGIVCAWSGRLGWHLFRRVTGHHPVEDGRYAQLRIEWGGRADVKMFWFYQLQGVVLLGLSIPFLLVARNPAPGLALIEWIGAGLALLALAGEALADHQLNRFKADPANRGRTCREGLWSCSRHPNYFFEWLVWVGFFVMALGSPGGVFTIGSPALILYFLLTKTGIPATEEQALRTKGDDYRDYQRTTSAFVPWFNRKAL